MVNGELCRPLALLLLIFSGVLGLAGVVFLIAAWLHPYTDAGFVVNAIFEIIGIGALASGLLLLLAAIFVRSRHR